MITATDAGPQVGAAAPEAQPWGRYVTVTDPDGNGLVIQQTTATS